MVQKENRTPQNISRQDEEQHLKKTLELIDRNLENYGVQVKKMKEDIDEMLEHYHDNDQEVYVILNNTITLHDHMKRALERNLRAKDKPYFGRICFWDELLNKEESLYIGKGGISSDATHQAVTDWRAPVANAYYENGLGPCSYKAPDGKEIHIDLQLKRTYEIEAGKLLEYFDSEVIANDDLLTKYLAKNKQAVLGEIVATIQKEQNEIIRKSPYHNIIVQGVAGSGKTTVAMHRISFILYNYAERFQPDDFYIVGSNRILLNYITGVLPDLDVHGVRQMTMEQLFIRLLYEDWDDKKYHIRPAVQSGVRENVKGSTQWFEDLKAYCDKVEWNTVLRESIYLNRKQFVEGLRDRKSGVYDESNETETRPADLILLVDGSAVERYIRQNPKVSLQSKINMLNERLLNKVKEEFWGKGISYTEAERRAIIKAYRGRYGSSVWKRSIFDMYREFLKQQISKGHPINIPGTEFDVYDLAALAYLYKRIKETEVISEAHHVVIDEAQDFGMMAYRVLDFCINGCTYTVMGDVSQNIRFGCGLNDWEELKEVLLSDEMASFGILKKSYRNTVEISDFAARILRHGRFVSYPSEPIIRHGREVNVKQTDDKLLYREAANICQTWQKEGFETIAVVCRNAESAKKAAAGLADYMEIINSDPETAEFGAGVMVLPVEYTKGLEFDAVLILNPSGKDYPTDDGHAKLLYVAATRALHELCVLHCGDLTGLISDPIPEGNAENAEKEAKKAGRMICTPSVVPEKSASSAGTIEKRPADAQEKLPAGVARPAALRRPKVSLPRTKPADENETTAQRPLRQTASENETAPQRLSRQIASASSDEKNDRVRSASPVFGDLPATERLRPAGHSKVDLAVRWTFRQADGLYLQSRFGTLRLSPISSTILRVTFARGSQIAPGVCPQIAAVRVEKYWMYRDNGTAVEFSTDELILRVNKSDGSIRYMTRDRKTLLNEKAKECRRIEEGPFGKRSFLYLDPDKEEHIYAMKPGKPEFLSLRSTARYISGKDALPFLFSDKGYGILPASEGPVLFCDIPAYGSYLAAEGTEQLDFYFIVGKKQENLLNSYAYLCKGQ